MKRELRFLLSLVTAVVILAGLPARTSAAPITFTFDGTVSFVQPLLAGTFDINDSLTGSLTYDSTLLDSNGDPNVGRYAPLSSLAFSIEAYTPTFVDASGFVNVTNGPPGLDQLGLRGDVTGPAVNGFKPSRLTFSLVDTTGQVFSSDALPLAFDTSRFTLIQFIVTFTNRANPNDLTSPGVSFTGLQGTFSGRAGATAVPEPATLTLFGFGLAAAAATLRRRHRVSRARREGSGDVTY